MFYKAPEEKIERMIKLFNKLPIKFQDYALQQIEQLVHVVKQAQ
jgi:hypothetical protein